MRTFRTLSCVFLFAALSLSGQTLQMGATSVSLSPESGAGAGYTSIDLTRPATADGTVTTVRFTWGAAPCTVKIKFLRRSGNTLTLIAERSVVSSSGVTEVALTPAVDVLRGDLIGIFGPADCGNADYYRLPSASLIALPSEVSGSTTFTGEHTGDGFQLNLTGWGDAAEGSSEIWKATLPVVGSAAGAFGSFFRTSIQLAHPGDFPGPISGRILFHRAGTAGSPDDPSLSYVIQPGQVVTYPDFLPEIGLSGLGSADFVVPEDMPMPLVSARVFNDAGSAGTSGLSEPVVDNAGMLIADDRDGYLVTPVDPSRTRFNIGTRTFEDANVTYILHNAAGVPIASTVRTYPAHYFEQVSAESLFGSIEGSRLVRIRSSGAVVVYGSTTDNTTNDPALQYATVRPIP